MLRVESRRHSRRFLSDVEFCSVVIDNKIEPL
jgi:hypothetical protein